ncbi:hypothetical protein C360_03006 [Cryptococcus neoformans Bt15]|nr:hypothetical protein C360_03006 [Cryptococcus neoformans var. grubii Bt15]
MSGWTPKTKATQAHIETLEKSIFAVPSHLSAFDLFPDFDEILHAVVDPIYALLEGILPFYIRKWIARAPLGGTLHSRRATQRDKESKIIPERHGVCGGRTEYRRCHKWAKRERKRREKSKGKGWEI